MSGSQPAPRPPPRGSYSLSAGAGAGGAGPAPAPGAAAGGGEAEAPAETQAEAAETAATGTFVARVAASGVNVNDEVRVKTASGEGAVTFLGGGRRAAQRGWQLSSGASGPESGAVVAGHSNIYPRHTRSRNRTSQRRGWAAHQARTPPAPSAFTTGRWASPQVQVGGQGRNAGVTLFGPNPTVLGRDSHESRYQLGPGLSGRIALSSTCDACVL